MASNSLYYGDNLDILRRYVQDESSRALGFGRYPQASRSYYLYIFYLRLTT